MRMENLVKSSFCPGVSLGLAFGTILVAESIASLTCMFGWLVSLPSRFLHGDSIVIPERVAFGDRINLC